MREYITVIFLDWGISTSTFLGKVISTGTFLDKGISTGRFLDKGIYIVAHFWVREYIQITI